MRTVVAGVLDIAYYETGRVDGAPVILLHGFPYDAHAYEAVAERLAAAGKRCIVPFLRGYGATRFLDPDTPRSGEQAALGADLLALMDALSIPSAVLAGYDWGGRAACIVAALWPDRVRGLVSGGAGYNIQNIARSVEPDTPEAEYRFWYQYYFHSERGRIGLAADRRGLCRLLWRLWSPTWSFDEETFARSASAFDNPDFVATVIHSYRHRFGLVAGDPAYAEIERYLAAQPTIATPTIVLQGGDDGVDPPGPADTAHAHFTGPYERLAVPGAGHNLPQEAPEAFADAVLAVG
ncbi:MULTISPECIES: alpha/beta fold hydrolase [unclassified Rhizobium]|uniref:alpha/beta fold hydrolase n=1 Tax=unclassified Rhizobium TaxID=2613769 RepID=UPI001ADB2531|nr:MULTISPECIES: alpha/beta hydrolase [unclassified Rhizobium]MBO9097088.1 alpha/beta hydrolase [Rhizobium sp. L58/93]MBO9134060.1 alpha/beta hydrolase [Rhizobium sp. B209b/85]MBO9167326.1 alpha/beta hydrolase [Rhizobium sp. L245/93]MBO9183285.1 alpha/beta hydrolase [Rhizobium sp. E27B/91]QXZ83627.1 alpha/beta hydrolase [Rhizobium sp. K1/93]